MKNIIFDISIRLASVQSERKSKAIASLDQRGLRGLGKGRIFVIFEGQRDYICLETEVLDYLLQLKGVLKEIDSGNHETFAVSGDYFSNNLRFTFRPEDKSLEIYEVNGGRFRISTRYHEFRSAYSAFFGQAISDFLLLYPELEENEAFRESCV